MLKPLIAQCVQRRLAAVVVTVVIALFGAHAYLETPIEAYPDVTNTQVTVITLMPGYAPEEVERQVTIPLERALNGTPGMLQMRSQSLFGLSLVTLTFNDGVDSFHSRTLITERLSRAELPAEVRPTLAPDYTPLGEIYKFVLTSDRHSLYELRSEMEWGVSRVLRQVQGVADVLTFGGFYKEIHVEIDPVKMESFNLTLDEINQAITSSNRNVGAGFYIHGDQQMVIRGVGYLKLGRGCAQDRPEKRWRHAGHGRRRRPAGASRDAAPGCGRSGCTKGGGGRHRAAATRSESLPRPRGRA